jgi:hypothetical protein
MATSKVEDHDRSPIVEHAHQVPRSDTMRVGAINDPAEHRADHLAESALGLAAEYKAATEAAAGPLAGELAVDRQAVARASTSGQALDGDVRERMESGFDRDLGHVRVHTGPGAAQLSAQMGAKAFTTGSDVYFGKGEYRPGTPTGDNVLAHEIAHTVADRGSGGGSAGAGPQGVHRFPATAMSQPVGWSSQTAGVFRPGEGASGGVYILSAAVKNDPVQKVVVKPVFGANALGLAETSAQITFADRALAEMFGLRAPKSRAVGGGTPEFNELVAVCSPKQPPGPRAEDLQEGEVSDWKPLAQAQAFVVMSEVPNAKSMASLSQSAATDQTSADLLTKTVFSAAFLEDLGRLCIGDLLIGNPDRMVYGAMNLGNVMLSVQQGKTELHAIDSAAQLPKKVSPEDVASYGGTVAGRANAKKTLDEGPGPVLDGFFETVVANVKRGAPAPQQGAPPPLWQAIDDQYKATRQRWLAAFEYGWTAAMISVYMMNEQDASGATAGYDDPNVGSDALKINASYIGERAFGGSHDDAVGRGVGIALFDWASKLDLSTLTQPVDFFHHTTVTVPDAKALSADFVDPPSLPSAAQLEPVVGDRGWGIPPDARHAFDAAKMRIVAADGEVDGLVSPTKKKGVFTRKEVPRNRNQAAHFVVRSEATILGAVRAAESARVMMKATQNMKGASAAKFKGGEASRVAEVTSYIGVAGPVVQNELVQYKSKLTTVKGGLNKTRHPDKKKLVAIVDRTIDSLGMTDSIFTDLKKADLKKIAASIRSR